MKQHKTTKNSKGQFYIVPTPIGNLSDITQRALTVLQHVDLIAAENIQHTKLLLQYFSINTRLFVIHNYNEKQKLRILMSELQKGKSIALVSNAGTPLINDPGYHLVRACHEVGIRVIPLPGPCAAITALSASGLSTSRFCYEGFLSSKSKDRHKRLKELADEPRTIIFYESTHRLLKSLDDMIVIWGVSRYVVLVRELTKIWETIYGAPVGKLLQWIKEDKNRLRGEIVLIVEGYQREKKSFFSSNVLNTLSLLQSELSFKRAIVLTAKIHNIKKNDLYKKYKLK